eukprot:EG_transcript_3090
MGGRFLRAVLWGLATYGTVTQGAPILRPSNPSAFVTAHNVLRCMHGLPPVTWSSTLAASAQTWASVCNGAVTNISMRLAMNFGENLVGTTGALARPQAYVNVWYDTEIDLFDFSLPMLQPGTGHLTQVIWKSTTEIGCARCERGDGSDWKFTVCQYSPPGNGPYVEDNIFPPVHTRQECTDTCVDDPVGWLDSYNYACSQYDSLNLCYPDGTYAEGWSPGWGPFSRYANNGKDATQACCVCGGGVKVSPRSPSPSDSAQPSPSPAPSWSPVVTPSPSGIPSASPRPSSSRSPAATPSASAAPSASSRPSASPSAPASLSASASPSASPRPIVLGTDTTAVAPIASPGPSASPSAAPTPITSGYSKCADEGGTCSCSGSVQYGAVDTWTAPRDFTGPVACSNGIFGDPRPGRVKACYCLPASPQPSPSAAASASPSPSPSPLPSPATSDYSKCADEMGTCYCNGSVKYGVGDIWTVPRTITGQIACTNNQFGDPKPGRVKACLCLPAGITANAAAITDDTSSPPRPTDSASPTSNVWPWLALPFALLALAVALGALLYCHRHRRAQRQAETVLDPEGLGRAPALLPLPPLTTGCSSPHPNPVFLPDDGAISPTACLSPALPPPPPGSPVAGPPAK